MKDVLHHRTISQAVDVFKNYHEAMIKGFSHPIEIK